MRHVRAQRSNDRDQHRAMRLRALVVLALLLLFAALGAPDADAALSFDGINDCLVSASTINLTAYTKLTLVAWQRIAAYANDLGIFIETAPQGTGVGSIQIIGDLVTGLARAYITGVTGESGERYPKPSAGAWHHIAYVFDFGQPSASQVLAIYVDGVSQTLTNDIANNTQGTSSFGNLTWNVMCRNNASFYEVGDVAELAIYGGIILTQAQITQLQTRCPNKVGAPTHYWPLARDGTASIGGVNFTVNGAVASAHPIACDLPPQQRRIRRGVGPT
jgi:hypothetical protein